MPSAWIVPKNDQSTLWVRLDATHYREAERPIVDKGPIPMPLRAVHWLDIERDFLVFAHQGQLHILRGLLQQAKPQIVKIPGKPHIHALHVIDDVVYSGADAGKSMLGYLDLRAPEQWKSIEVDKEVNWTGKGVDGFARHGSRLIAIDDIVLPRFLLVLDIANPRMPKWIEHRDFPAHSSYERIQSVTSNEETVIMLSTTANHGASALHIGFMNLATLEEYAVLSVQGSRSFRKWADRSYDFHAIALQGKSLLIAAGPDGLGILHIPPLSNERPSRPGNKRLGLSQAQRLFEDNVRFVPIPQGPVVGVVPVDEAHAFAIIERPANGIFTGSRIDSVLVDLPL